MSNTKFKFCGDDGTCGCSAKQPTKYTKEGSMKIIAEWKNKKKLDDAVQQEEDIQLEFTADDVLKIFQKITDSDMELMGFNPLWNRPEWMICKILPVPTTISKT